MFLVYLAGPVTGSSYQECTSWRQYVIDNLPEGIKGLSPLRAKSYLETEQCVAAHYGEEFPLSTPRGIYARDRFDVRRADALLVNLLQAPRISIGTVMEIAWAADNNIPVVLMMEEGNIHWHPMIMEACPFVVNDLDSGITVVKALLLPSSH